MPFYSLTLLMLATAAASTYGVSEWSSNSLASPDPHQTMGPCRCSDLKDLFNRKAEEARKFVRLGACQATADASSAFGQYRHANAYTATAFGAAVVLNEKALPVLVTRGRRISQ